MYDIGLIFSFIGAVVLAIFSIGFIGTNIMYPDASAKERIVSLAGGLLCQAGSLALAGFFIGAVF